jgi:hypothetical protein
MLLEKCLIIKYISFINDEMKKTIIISVCFTALFLFVFALCINLNKNRKQPLQISKQSKQAQDKEVIAKQDREGKAYINAGYGRAAGFEVNSPKNMFIRECHAFAGFSFDSTDITACGEGNPSLTPIIVSSNDYPALYHSWEKYTALEKEHYDENFNQVTIQDLKINDVPAKKFSGTIKEKSQLKDPFMRDFDSYVAGKRLTLVIVRGDNSYFSLILNYNKIKKGDTEKYETAFENIVSSFKALQK